MAGNVILRGQYDGKNVNTKHYLNYIGQRLGVELEVIDRDAVADSYYASQTTIDDYTRYISYRPGVDRDGVAHGLFSAQGTVDIDYVREQLGGLEHCEPLRWYVSLPDYESAREAGLESKKDWVEALGRAMPRAFDTMELKFDRTEWVAAYHTNTDHPHVHIIIWDKYDLQSSPTDIQFKTPVGNTYWASGFQPKLLDAKIVMTKELYSDLRQELYQERDIAREEVKRDALGFTKDNTLISADITERRAEQLSRIAEHLPGRGRMVYDYLDPSVKDPIDAMAREIASEELAFEISTLGGYAAELEGHYHKVTDPEIAEAVKNEYERNIAAIRQEILKGAVAYRQESFDERFIRNVPTIARAGMLVSRSEYTQALFAYHLVRLGYTPEQIDTLYRMATGREELDLLSTLKGLERDRLEYLADDLRGRIERLEGQHGNTKQLEGRLYRTAQDLDLLDKARTPEEVVGMRSNVWGASEQFEKYVDGRDIVRTAEMIAEHERFYHEFSNSAGAVAEAGALVDARDTDRGLYVYHLAQLGEDEVRIEQLYQQAVDTESASAERALREYLLERNSQQIEFNVEKLEVASAQEREENVEQSIARIEQRIAALEEERGLIESSDGIKELAGAVEDENLYSTQRAIQAWERGELGDIERIEQQRADQKEFDERFRHDATAQLSHGELENRSDYTKGLYAYHLARLGIEPQEAQRLYSDATQDRSNVVDVLREWGAAQVREDLARIDERIDTLKDERAQPAQASDGKTYATQKEWEAAIDRKIASLEYVRERVEAKGLAIESAKSSPEIVDSLRDQQRLSQSWDRVMSDKQDLYRGETPAAGINTVVSMANQLSNMLTQREHERALSAAIAPEQKRGRVEERGLEYDLEIDELAL